ncbi:MAG: GAF domain-containing protein [Candidatus Thermoplasmatota archaeon]|nr:GAF domain-containing protein [Candidatus Thermoplasmatota archaeon]
MKYAQAEQKLARIIEESGTSSHLQQIVDFLYETFDTYSWIGIYLVKGKTLVLGPWKGTQATEHTRIPVGTGICGSAAKSGKTELIPDVNKDTRYLSCFVSTKSEIVVPIRFRGKVVGEIDIDSDVPHAFTTKDVVFLEKVADMLAMHIC